MFSSQELIKYLDDIDFSFYKEVIPAKAPTTAMPILEISSSRMNAALNLLLASVAKKNVTSKMNTLFYQYTK